MVSIIAQVGRIAESWQLVNVDALHASDFRSNHPTIMRVLAVSGSLRSQSTNTSLLRALALLAPPEVEVVLYKELDQIPPFNPDRESEGESGPVARFRALLKQADLIVFSSPEYAHGVPGALKNALDWVVGSGELSGKRVAFVNASSRAVYAQASLKETIKTMDAQLVSDAEVTVDVLPKSLTPEEIAEAPQFAAALQLFLRSVGPHP
jgi:chromate reductase